MGTHSANPSIDDDRSDCYNFLRLVLNERGCQATLLVALLLSLGIGSVIGLIPDTIADRYARVHHEYSGARCNSFDIAHKPLACQLGADDAQYAATISNVGLNLLSFLLNPVIGSVSDAHGRRGMILLSLVLSIIPAVVFLLLLNLPFLLPFWYYLANATGGSTYFIGISFAALSDVIPSQHRSSGYGLLLSCFYGGFAIGPSVEMFVSREGVAVASLSLMTTALIVALIFFPETLPDAVREENSRSIRNEEKPDEGFFEFLVRLVARPWHDISILNQHWVIRFVAAGSFFSSMVYASDVTLVVYYIEEQLSVSETDLAWMFLTFGLIGIILQGCLIQPLVRFFRGEKNLLVATFLCGALHNTLYGVASTKRTILIALILAQFTKLNFPVLSSLASQGASTNEQGRIQGALFASNSLASAFGPLSMEYVYGRTKGCRWGPGTMFFYAALLQLIGTCTVSYIPSIVNEDIEGVDQGSQRQHDICEVDLEQLLLSNPEAG